MTFKVRVVTTFCPKRLRPSDHFDFSGMMRPYLRLRVASGTRVRLGYTPARDVFPPNTRGFLYYYTPPKAPLLAGELRFRCANNLEGFSNGKDLLCPDKFNPWSIPLHELANRASFVTLAEQLMFDGLVSQITLDKWNKKAIDTFTGNPRECGAPHPVLYYLRQPLLIRFDRSTSLIYTVTKDNVALCALHKLTIHKSQKVDFLPYRGSGIVQIEPFAHPQRPGKDIVAFRLLKIVEPVQDLVENYEGRLYRPTEGMLIQRSIIHAGRGGIKWRALNSKYLTAAAMLPVDFEDLE